MAGHTGLSMSLLTGIGTGRYDEVIFHPCAVAVVLKIDSRIDIFIEYILIVGNISMPLIGIIADEVIALVLHLFNTNHVWIRIGSDERRLDHD